MTSLDLRKITFALCIPMMMACIDVMALSVALDAIVLEFHTPIYQTQWLFTAYMIANSAFLIITGHLADMYGKQRLLLLGILGFTAASIMAVCSYNFWLLVIARGFQGISGAAIMTSSIALITSNFDLHERSQMLAKWMFSIGLGLACGPIVGGVIVNLVDWRWIFLVNIPIGIISYLWAKKFIQDSYVKDVAVELNLLNAFLLSITIIILALFLSEGGEWGWFSKSSISVCLAFIISFFLFMFFEIKKANSIVNISLYRQSSFILGIFSGFFSYFFMYAWLFIFSLYLQEVRGLSPLRASFICISYSIAFAFGPLILNKYFAKILDDRFILIGFLGVLLSFVGMSYHPLTIPLLILMATFFILGLSIAIINVSSMIIATQSVSKEIAGTVSGVIFTVRWLGGAIGVVVATVIYHSISIYALKRNLEGISNYDKLSESLFSNHILNTQQDLLMGVDNLVIKMKQALSVGLTSTFLILAVLSLACLIMVRLLQVKFKN